MSMLAERRRKTKWTITPWKKPLWTSDSDGIKFGKELMEKMGWSAGKGLGAREQGIQEPLSVSYKNDTKGMGFKENDDDWIEQQDEFNELLNQLRNNDDSPVVKVSEEVKNEIKSLEEKSKQSRARVHYQKFTRGKDLSRYSENDLACILGTNKMKKEKLKTEEVVESEEKSNGHLVTSFGVKTINSGLIQDYFKKKWTTDKVNFVNVEKEMEENSCDERPSFSRVFEESKEFSKKEPKKEDGAVEGSEMNGDSGEKYEKRKKRKKNDVETSEEEEPKNKRKKDGDNPVDEEMQKLVCAASDEVGTENLLGCENNCDSSRKRKKEKRKSKEHDGSEEADGLEVKKKKKKERKEKQVGNGYCETELASIDCIEEECPEGEGELVKKKKKGKTRNEVFGEAKKENVEETVLEVNVGEMNGAVEEEDAVAGKGKKKKKCKDHTVSARTDELGEKNEVGKVSGVCEGGEVGNKKKKKKKEMQGEDMECNRNEIQVEKCDGGNNSNSTAELEKVKKKKKKKEKQEDKTEGCSSENGLSSEIQAGKCDNGSSFNTTELEVKKKKKKREPEEDKVESSSYEKCEGENSCNGSGELEEVKKKKKKKEKQDEGKVECNSNGSEIQLEKCDGGIDSNSTAELEEIRKKKKKKEKQDEGKVECNSNGSEIQLEKCDGGIDSNSTAELEEIRKKKKKKEKQGGGINGSETSSEIQVGECGSNPNSTAELEEVKKKRKKKEKEGGINGHESSSEIQVGECGSNPNSTAELEEVKKKRKKKEKEGGINGSETSSEIQVGECGSNPNSTTELEVKKKKKKDKHKTKEEDSNSNHMKESCLEEPYQESNPSETVQKKKKKKEKQKSKEESSIDHQEQETCPDEQSELGSARKRKKTENEGSKEEGEGKMRRDEGNAEIGTAAGIDKVELISQRAAYEHVAGQHRYERVKKMMEFVNLARFRGSNLEGLDGYGNALRKCQTSAS